jgi:hypothetical protein
MQGFVCVGVSPIILKAACYNHTVPSHDLVLKTRAPFLIVCPSSCALNNTYFYKIIYVEYNYHNQTGLFVGTNGKSELNLIRLKPSQLIETCIFVIKTDSETFQAKGQFITSNVVAEVA